MAILNLNQVAELLGFKSSASVRRLLKRGVLDDYRRPGPDGRSTYLETEPEGLPTLKQQVQRHTECHFNSPLWRLEPEPSQEAWAQRCNSYLECAAWGGPPFTADQWATLRVVLELASN